MTATTTAKRSNGSIDMTGWCRDCRAYSHKLCVALDCACTMGRHDKRGAVEPPEDPLADVRARANGGGSAPPASGKPVARVAKKARAPRFQPVWELAKEDPPARPPKPTRPPKLTPAQQVQPLLEAIVDADDRDWHRVGIFGSLPNAGRVRRDLAKAFPDEWEWKAARDSQDRPAVFARWTAE